MFQAEGGGGGGGGGGLGLLTLASSHLLLSSPPLLSVVGRVAGGPGVERTDPPCPTCPGGSAREDEDDDKVSP